MPSPPLSTAIRSPCWGRIASVTRTCCAAICLGPKRIATFEDGSEVPLQQGSEAGFFHVHLPHIGRYRLRIRWPGGEQETADTYAFGPQLSDLDLHLIGEGRHLHLADAFGANVVEVDDVHGTRFAVWAPNASRVAVIGDFNGWDARRHPMRLRHQVGV